MIRMLGRRGILLTDAESRCFYIAQGYQRRNLWREIFALNKLVWPESLAKLHWSDSLVRLIMQGLVVVVSLPFIISRQAIVFLFNLFMFPYRYTKTFTIPGSLAAPGEKTVIGIHNAFGQYFDLATDEYVRCLEDWVRELYGEELAKSYSLRSYINGELKRVSLANGVLSTSFRNHVAVARAKLSKDLGHYLA